MSKHIKLLLILGVLLLILFQVSSKHLVTFYLTVGSTDGKTLNRHVNLVIDGDTLFQDSLVNHIFVAEIVKAELSAGFHSLKVFNNGRNIVDQDFFFVFFDQHLVLEYFDDCDGEKPCYVTNNKLRRHYIE